MANVYDAITRQRYIHHAQMLRDQTSAEMILELVRFMDEVGDLRGKNAELRLQLEALRGRGVADAEGEG